MTFNFIERILHINRNSTSKDDGIAAMKIIIAMLENLQGRIDEALPYILKLCINELAVKTTKNYTSMVLQTITMSFWYNSVLTF